MLRLEEQLLEEHVLAQPRHPSAHAAILVASRTQDLIRIG
jgi:hypothetical protein